MKIETTIQVTQIAPASGAALNRGTQPAGTRYAILSQVLAGTCELADSLRTTIRVGRETFTTYDLPRVRS